MNTTTQPNSLQALAFPLTDFYAHAGLPLPPIEIISGDAVPEPGRAFLVHNNEVTPMLETFHKSLCCSLPQITTDRWFGRGVEKFSPW